MDEAKRNIREGLKLHLVGLIKDTVNLYDEVKGTFEGEAVVKNRLERIESHLKDAKSLYGIPNEELNEIKYGYNVLKTTIK